MNCYPMAALERAMKIQDAILRALAQKITGSQAAEAIGISDRPMRRWHWRYRELGRLFAWENRCNCHGPAA
jgi:hypothetical protein